MTTIVDTHRLINELKQRGFTDEQAEGITDAIAAQRLDHLATRADLRDELRTLEVRLLKWSVPVLISQIAAFSAIAEWLIDR